MYRLTPRMIQRLRKGLARYHDLFDAGRCSGRELEELLVVCIRSDTQVLHDVSWQETGHDKEKDIMVQENGKTHLLQVKSGKLFKSHLSLSGHRLTRYKENFKLISEYLNDQNKADVLSVPYRQTNDEHGRKHTYSIWYIDSEHFSNVDPDGWEKNGGNYEQMVDSGIVYSLRPSMSWQIWWEVPFSIIEKTEEFSIGD